MLQTPLIQLTADWVDGESLNACPDHAWGLRCALLLPYGKGQAFEGQTSRD